MIATSLTPFHFSFQTFGKIIHLLGHLLLIYNLGCTLEQTGMQVENIARISFTTGRTTKNQRYFAISYCLFRQIIINYQRMTTCIAKILANGSSCKRSKIL